MAAPRDTDDSLRDLLETGSPEEIVLVLAGLDPQEVADVLEAMPESIADRAFEAMGIRRQAAVLRAVEDEETREELIDELADGEIADIAELLPSDDAADLVQELPEERRERVMQAIERERREEIEVLDRYGPETAGGIMQTELIRVVPSATVAAATQVVRTEYDASMGDLFDVYVVDETGRVQGRVRSRQLLVTADHVPVHAIMTNDVRTVPVDMDQEEIAEIVADYDVASVAVVDADDRLVGRIMVDDILDVIEEEATEDVAKMAGTAPGDVYSVSVVTTVKSRLPWLLATFGGGLLTAALIMTWEEDLVLSVPLYAAVIPIVMGMSGNVGTQAATVTVRGLAIGEINYSHVGRVLAKELLSGITFGVFFGALLFPILRWGMPAVLGVGIPEGLDPFSVVLVPVCAISLTIILAAATGTLVPLALHKLGKDPAVASAPFITTTVDVLAIALLVAVKFLVL